GLDERADAGVVGKLQADANLIVRADVLSVVCANPHPAGGKVHDLSERLARPAGAVPAINGDALHIHIVAAMLPTIFRLTVLRLWFASRDRLARGRRREDVRR